MRQRWIFGLAALGLLVACGGDDTPTQATATPAPQAEAASTAAAGSDEGLPRVVGVSLAPLAPEGGDVVRARAQVKGPGPHRLHYIWQVGNRSIEDETGAIELPSLRKGEVVGVTVTASNAAGRSEPVSHQVRVGNVPPRIVDLRLNERPDDGQGGPAWVAEVMAKDEDGDRLEIEYTWFVDDEATEQTGEVFPVSELRRGSQVRVQVRAGDGEAWSDYAESGVVEIENTSPTIASRPPRLDENGVFRYPLEVEDADGDRRFRYHLVRGPKGMKIDFVSGEVQWKPDFEQAGVHPVEIAVEDYHGGRATQTFELPIVVKTEGEAAPAARR